MNKIRWRILWTICLLVSAILVTITGQAWASVSYQSANKLAQIQTDQVGQQDTKNMVTLLSQDEEVQLQQSSAAQNIQIITFLLLDVEDEAQQKVFLPLITR